MRRSTVYLIAQPTISTHGKQPNIEPVAKYGSIRVLIQAGEYPTFNPGRCLDLIRSRLEAFDPEQDYLVWAGGDTLAAVLTGVVLAERGVQEVTWLRYERGRDRQGARTDEGSRYVPITVPLHRVKQLELDLSVPTKE